MMKVMQFDLVVDPATNQYKLSTYWEGKKVGLAVTVPVGAEAILPVTKAFEAVLRKTIFPDAIPPEPKVKVYPSTIIRDLMRELGYPESVVDQADKLWVDHGLVITSLRIKNRAWGQNRQNLIEGKFEPLWVANLIAEAQGCGLLPMVDCVEVRGAIAERISV